MAEQFWNRHDDADRLQFGLLMAPLVTASRTKAFTKAEASVYMLTMQDVPKDVVAHGVSRLIEQGITWMPKPGDIKAVCCDIVDERRREAAKRAAALKDECAQCGGSQWVSSLSEGVETVKRCWCFTRGLELIAEAGEPLKRPALPASTEPQEVA